MIIVLSITLIAARLTRRENVMKKALLLIVSFLFAINAVYAEENACITAREAIGIAKQKAIERGRSQDWFDDISLAQYDVEHKRWLIAFMGKGVPGDFQHYGNHFSVYVSCDGKDVEF